MLILQVIVRHRAGRFDSLGAVKRGWECVYVCISALLSLMQIDSPRLTRSMVLRLRAAAKTTATRNSLSAEIEIGKELGPQVDSTVSALNHFVSADSIAAMSIDDPRKAPLTKFNRIIARDAFTAAVRIGAQTIMIQDLAMAPLARLDTEWAGTAVVRTTSWDAELPAIIGHDAGLRRVEVRLAKHRHRFNELMQQQASFIVVTGRGFRNETGLRILAIDQIGICPDEDMPPQFRHIAGLDE